MLEERLADAVVRVLAGLGIRDVFTVTGGAAMHLNDAFGINQDITCHYLHHEQACAMAAEGYARINWQPAAVCVTAGPGALNAINGVFGAYTDSIPMFVVSGQSRSDTLMTSPGSPEGIRQLGDQEANVIEMVRSITKAAHQLTSEDDVESVIRKLYEIAIKGRPGPVWLEIPVNLQGSFVEKVHQDPTENQIEADSLNPNEEDIEIIRQALILADRPVIIAGTGVRAAGAMGALVDFAEATQTPVATAWTHDCFPNEHPLYAGRPGTIGTRPGNLVVQAADLVIVFGSRLNIRQVSYNWAEFAPNARIIHVDIDKLELQKHYLNFRVGHKIVADLRSFLPRLALISKDMNFDRRNWLDWISTLRDQLEPTSGDYKQSSEGINPYHFVMELNNLLGSTDIVVSGDATACIVPFQILELRKNMRLFSNSGAASMGYDLPAALGASIAAKGKRVLCLAGDGSIMMNLQELQTLRASDNEILLFILDNNGYLSIKQTQANFFGRSFGSSPESGITFPDFEKVANGFDLPAITLRVDQNWQSELKEFLSLSGSRVCIIKLDQSQEFEPRIKSKMTSNGIFTPPLDDMHPHLDPERLSQLRSDATTTSTGRAKNYEP